MTDIRRVVEKAQGGEREAFAALFEDSRDRLRKVIGSRLGSVVRNGVDPSDVLQDTFVRAWHSLDRFVWRGEASFRGWLDSIAERVTVDVVRRRRRRVMLQLEGNEKAGSVSPSRGLARRERLHRLEGALQTLTPDHREVLLLSRIEGLSIADTAARMGRSESAVKNLLLRAMKQLRLSFGQTESLSLGSGQLGGSEETDGR